jgi:primosomal protein N' (replication factor Y)
MTPAAVEVALAVPQRRTFTYLVSPDLAGRAVPGARVLVPFGKRRVVGVIVGPSDGTGSTGRAGRQLRSVIELPDEQPLLAPEILELTRWAADYYQCSWGEMIRAALPGGFSVRPRHRLKLTAAGRERAESLLPGAKRPLQAGSGAPGRSRGSRHARRIGLGEARRSDRFPPRQAAGLHGPREVPGDHP